MKTKTFNDYEEACVFCDKVDGQIQWCSYKGNQYWTVWFSTNNHRSRQGGLIWGECQEIQQLASCVQQE